MRLQILVEGQTEDEFVKHTLAPHLGERNVWVSTMIVETSRDARGRKRRGGGHWKHWLRDLRNLTRDGSDDVRFTTLFDLYGLPDDFPEFDALVADKNTARRADAIAAAMARAVNDTRLIAYVQRHEFEALVLASLSALRSLVDAPDAPAVDALSASLGNLAPEDINDGETTAPSKRLEQAIPGYRKTVHGPLAIHDTGLPALRRACPRFDAWIRTLESLGAPSK